MEFFSKSFDVRVIFSIPNDIFANDPLLNATLYVFENLQMLSGNSLMIFIGEFPKIFVRKIFHKSLIWDPKFWKLWHVIKTLCYYGQLAPWHLHQSHQEKAFPEKSWSRRTGTVEVEVADDHISARDEYFEKGKFPQASYINTLPSTTNLRKSWLKKRRIAKKLLFELIWQTNLNPQICIWKLAIKAYITSCCLFVTLLL